MAILYGVPVSPFVRKTMLAHACKGVDFELKMIPPSSDEPEFRQASPFGKIPGYRTDDGVFFADSSVIIAYLEKTVPKTKLYPEDPNDYARALWLEEFADTKMMEATAGLYFQRVIGPKFVEHKIDNARVAELVTKLIPAVLDYAESQLSYADWFVDGVISVADIAIGTNLVNLHHANFDIDSLRWPKLAEFNTRFMGLEIVKNQLKQEAVMLAEA